eukprot:gene7926-10759_t
MLRFFRKNLCTFLLGWISGSIFILIFFEMGEESQSMMDHSHRYDLLKGNSQRKFLRSVKELEFGFIKDLVTSHTLSPTKSRVSYFIGNKTNDNELADNEDWIFLDWPADDKIFTLENYKALESMLTAYPRGIIRCIIVAALDAYTHKAGNSLSVMQFSKYSKLRYNLQVIVTGKIHDDQVPFGVDYRDRWMRKCCESCNTRMCRENDHVQPFHLLNFVRLSKLYARGGISSDFSFFFLSQISPNIVKHGYFMNTFCRLIDYEESLLLSRENMMKPSNNSTCFTSSLLVFREPRSRILSCLLSKYDDLLFIACIESDLIQMGANCIRNSYKECFSQLGLNNDLDASVSGKSIIESFNNDAYLASRTLLSSNWTISTDTNVLWLGELAWKCVWNQDVYRNGTMLGAAVTLINLHRDVINNHEVLQCPVQRPICSHYSSSLTNNNNTLFADNINATYNNNSIEYSKYSINHIDNNDKNNNISFATNNNMISEGLQDISCSPSIIIAGFMKSASTYLYNVMRGHPQILSALAGSQHKETQCYTQNKLINRMWCYPLIEKNDNFVSLDGTVYYALDPSVPYALKKDNPAVKVIFVVREPVSRMYSSYKFMYQRLKAVGSFDSMGLVGMVYGDKFGELREMLMNGTSRSVIVSYFYNSIFAASPAVGGLFIHSFYAPVIELYQSVLGVNNVKIVLSDDLEGGNGLQLNQTLNDIFRFLGVCTLKNAGQSIPHSLPGHNVIPVKDQMSQDIANKLDRFFDPFNQWLSNITHLNITSWSDNHNQMKYYENLPKFSFGNNESLSPLWFENDQRSFGYKPYEGKLVPHLLPQRKSEVDNGFNTTLGMLITFR